MVNGKLYFSCDCFETGSPTEGDRAGFVQLLMGRGPAGLYIGLSPELARKVADALMRGADNAEAALARSAAAMMKDAGL